VADILVVDDDILVRNVLRQILLLNRHNVLEAADGQDALDLININGLPDLVLMDHQMPRLTGIECAKRLRTLYPHLKIVLITGSFGINDDGYLATNKYLFTDVLLKPFQIKDVVGAVDYAMNSRTETKSMSAA